MLQKLLHSSHLSDAVSQLSMLFCLMLFLAVQRAYAADEVWIQRGPGGGIIQTLAIDPASPQVLYAGTYDGGAYKSTNAGDTWVPINSGLTSTDINALIVDPLTTRTLYAGASNGAYKSTNGGASWVAINTGLGSGPVYALSIDPKISQTLYAGTGYGVFKSQNGGNIWSAANKDLNGDVIALAIDPENPQTLYAVGNRFGIIIFGNALNPSLYKSTDGGNSWRSANLQYPIQALAMDPVDPQTIYVSIKDSLAGGSGSGSVEIYKTTNGGGAWTPADTGLNASQVNALTIDPANPQILYAGAAYLTNSDASNGIIYKSTDAGNTWSQASTSINYTSITTLIINPIAPHVLYAGSSNGIFKSQNGAETWNAVNTGISAHIVSNLTIDPITPQTLYASTHYGGIYKSTNGGSIWSSANTGLINTKVNALAINPLNPQILFAASEVVNDERVGNGYGLAKSTNGGASWITLDLPVADITSLAVSSTTPPIVYAGTTYNGSIGFSITMCNGVVRSSDGGDSWSFYGYDEPCVHTLAIDPTMPQTLYLGSPKRMIHSSNDEYVVFKSIDAGVTWHTSSLTAPNDIYALAINPKSPQTLYAGTDIGMYRSTDAGANWNPINSGLTAMKINALAIDSTTPSIVYAGTDNGVFRSTDAGNHWSSFNAGLNFLRVLSLAIDPTDSQKVYAGTRGGGVYILSSNRSSFGFNLSEGGVASSNTDGSSSSAKLGYAALTVNSGATPYGTAVFSFQQNGVTVSEAAVPASPPTTHAHIFVDYRSDVNAIPGRPEAGKIDVNTGIAVVNYGSETANVAYTLLDINGASITSGTGTIPAGNHFAKFIHQFNEIADGFSLPADFQNNIGFASLDIASDQPLSIVALRMTTNQRNDILYTTTPVADMTQSLTTNPIYFAQFADGGGYTSSLILLNTSTATETGTLQILDKDGLPVVVNQVGGTADSSFNYSIPARGVFLLRTDGSPAQAKVGWVRLTSSAGTSTPVGSGVFSYNSDGILVSESGVPATLPTTHARVYVDLSQNHNTGLAIANIDASSASITINAFQKDGVTPIGTSQGPLPLAGYGHDAKFADQLFADLPAGFTGVLDISSTTSFAALTIRSLYNENHDFLMTTFPVADVTRPAPSPIVFPQIADGAGYITEFILLSPSGASSSMLSIFDNSGDPLELGD
jgi:photosystem II stability/assembly factor-like uncharacterized protein